MEQDPFDDEFAALLQSLSISEPMSLAEYLDIQEEQGSHKVLSNEELLAAA